ncbi:2-oxoacid:acceptor oxidoreductase family protein [Chloroflexota bacterium]
MGQIEEIRFCGFGGQGIVLAGTILGYAVVEDGKYVAESNSYGPSARGSLCKADVVISNEPITYPHIIRTDILIALSQKSYNKYIREAKDNSLVIYDENAVDLKPDFNCKHVKVPATTEAVTQLNNRQVANTIMLAATVGLTKIISNESLYSAVKECVPERFLDVNMKAIAIGLELGQRIRKRDSQKC